jgi:hypothetical protein
MATLYVEEYSTIAGGPSTSGPAHAQVQAPQEIALASQIIAITGSSTQCTNPFNAATRSVRLHTDSICSVAFGVSPTAVTTQKRMAANQTEYFGVRNGDKVAVILNV